MPDMLLFVLIVSEVALRSTLAAQLSLAGANLITARDYDDPQLTRTMNRSTVLITDSGAASLREGGAQALSTDARWSRIVVLTPGVATTQSDDPRVFYVEGATAAAGIKSLARGWQAGH